MPLLRETGDSFHYTICGTKPRSLQIDTSYSISGPLQIITGCHRMHDRSQLLDAVHHAAQFLLSVSCDLATEVDSWMVLFVLSGSPLSEKQLCSHGTRQMLKGKYCKWLPSYALGMSFEGTIKSCHTFCNGLEILVPI